MYWFFLNLNGGLFHYALSVCLSVCLTVSLCFFLVITGFIIWSWFGLWAPGREQIAKKSTSKIKVNYSVESVGHGELVIFCKLFAAAREYSPLTIAIVIVGTLGWGNLVF